MRYSIRFLCVEVVSYVLRVEVCLGRAHKYFQDGVISDHVTLGRDSYPGVAGCGRTFFAIITSYHVGHYSISPFPG
jgi:hypothetical protein